MGLRATSIVSCLFHPRMFGEVFLRFCGDQRELWARPYRHNFFGWSLYLFPTSLEAFSHRKACCFQGKIDQIIFLNGTQDLIRLAGFVSSFFFGCSGFGPNNGPTSRVFLIMLSFLRNYRSFYGCTGVCGLLWSTGTHTHNYDECWKRYPLCCALTPRYRNGQTSLDPSLSRVPVSALMSAWVPFQLQSSSFYCPVQCHVLLCCYCGVVAIATGSGLFFYCWVQWTHPNVSYRDQGKQHQWAYSYTLTHILTHWLCKIVPQWTLLTAFELLPGS